MINYLITPIVDGIVASLKERRSEFQFEKMQSEILSGWIFRLKIAIERELHEHQVSAIVYEDVMKAINEVTEKHINPGSI